MGIVLALLLAVAVVLSCTFVLLLTPALLTALFETSSSTVFIRDGYDADVFEPDLFICRVVSGWHKTVLQPFPVPVLLQLESDDDDGSEIFLDMPITSAVLRTFSDG